MLVSQMIALYCKGNHGTAQLCSGCAGLQAYAQIRSERCPHMDTKTFCSNCHTHCYAPAMRAQIRAVMRYAGSRMLIRHPVPAIQHAYYARRRGR